MYAKKGGWESSTITLVAPSLQLANYRELPGAPPFPADSPPLRLNLAMQHKTGGVCGCVGNTHVFLPSTSHEAERRCYYCHLQQSGPLLCTHHISTVQLVE